MNFAADCVSNVWTTSIGFYGFSSCWILLEWFVLDFFLSCLHRSEIQPPPSLCVLSCLSSIYYFIRHNFNLFLFFFFASHLFSTILPHILLLRVVPIFIHIWSHACDPSWMCWFFLCFLFAHSCLHS